MNEHCALRVTHRVLVGGVCHTLLCRLRNLIGKQFARIYPDPWAALDHATPLYTALGDTVKKVVEFTAESITSVKSCEKHSNSA